MFPQKWLVQFLFCFFRAATASSRFTKVPRLYTFPESRSLPATGNFPLVDASIAACIVCRIFLVGDSFQTGSAYKMNRFFMFFFRVSACRHPQLLVFPRTGFLWMPQSGVRSYRHISNIHLSGWNYPPLQALSNVRTDDLSDRSADWTEVPSDSTRSFSYALFSDGTPPRSFLSRSRTGTASNGGGFFCLFYLPADGQASIPAPRQIFSHILHLPG